MFHKILHANDGSDHAFNALSLALKLRQRDAFAAASQHSHLVARFSALPDSRQSARKKPGIAPPNGGRSLSSDQRERVSVE
jgi:hypothetical protein